MKDITCKMPRPIMGLAVLIFTIQTDKGTKTYEYKTWNVAKAEQLNKMAVLKSGEAFNRAKELWGENNE